MATFRPKKNTQSNRVTGEAKIYVENGACYIDTNENVMGIELGFNGKAQITLELPSNWILQGNKKKIIMFTLQKAPIKSHKLFSYIGNINIVSAIIANDIGERLTELILEESSNWNNQEFDISIDTSKWESYKENKSFGKDKNTTYNLTEYNLPEVDKKIKTRRIATATRNTYTTGGGSTGGAGGSGGY